MQLASQRLLPISDMETSMAIRHYARTILLLLGMAASTLATGATVDPLPASAYMHPQQWVEVAPGRRLNLYCVGTGEPTVLFDSGLGDGTLIWRAIQADIGRSTRACSYDRANYFYSDNIQRSATAQASVDDMLTLIDKARLGQRVILVGHSRGGLNVRLFAYEHTDRMAGLVLIDATMLEKLSPTATPHYVQKYENYLQRGQKLRKCQQLALQHQLQVDGSDPSHCLDDFGVQTDPQEKALAFATRSMETGASFQGTLFSERQNLFYPIDPDGYSTDGLSIAQSEHSLGHLPLIVIMANGFKSAAFKGTPTPEQLQFFAWNSGRQRKVAGESTSGQFIEVGSEHYIQTERPDVVLAAIHRVLDMARSLQQYGAPTLQRR
jgi:pimeloyl-ACP methyl ester carboxylesterase